MRATRVLFSLSAGIAAMLAAASLGAGAGQPEADALAPAREVLTSARASLIANFDAAKKQSDDPYDTISRIDVALSALDDKRAASDAAYASDATLEAKLDAAWIASLLAGHCADPASLGKVGEGCARASSDGTLQPFALFVPAAYRAGQPTPAIVFLRGRGETESNLLARHELRALAEDAGAIVVAPYARGRALYDANATADVFDALDAVAKSLSVDPHRVYLAGFSMGGIAAFHVAATHPERFAAVLSVLGTLDPEDRAGIQHFASRPAYLVSASDDTLIPKENARQSVAYLRSVGVPARYYEQDHGSHALTTVLPALQRAWHDMLAGVTSPNIEGAPHSAPWSEPSATPAAARQMSS